MYKYQPYLKSIFFMFALWIIILILHAGWTIYTSDYKAKVGEEVFERFIFLNMGFGLIVITVGALLAWLTQQGKRWARWLFIVYCGWRAFDAIWGNFQLREMSPELLEITDWIRGGIFALVWVYFIGFAWYFKHEKQTTG